MKHNRTLGKLLILAALVALPINALAVGPSPEAKLKYGSESFFQERLKRHREFVEQGACSPAIHPVNADWKDKRLSAAAGAVDTIRVVVLLLDFSDHPYNGTTHGQGYAATPEDFDSLLFSIQGEDSISNNNGSMTEYYLENSYGSVHMLGEVSGWIRMDSTYAYYVKDSADAGSSRSRDFARDAINAANDSVDFSRFDYNGDGYLDGLILLHAGNGGEQGYFGIWSHMFSLLSDTTMDGITIRDYVIAPEEFSSELSPIGVITHEFGHYFGLYDFYDMCEGDPGHEGSAGLGAWSLMASGNYNNFGTAPAHLDPWSKIFIGFLTPTTVQFTGNVYNAQIPQVETDPVVYKLSNGSTSQYWLVENRQKTGFDRALLGHGLCIYHVDESVRDAYGRPTNSLNDHYFISLEQADGMDQMGETVNNRGDAGDPFPGLSDNRDFHNLTVPNSKTYLNNVTQIGVWNISNSGSIMSADLDIEYSRPWIELDSLNPLTLQTVRNGVTDNLIEPGDTVYLSFSARNYMRPTFGARATLTSSNADILLNDDSAVLAASIFAIGPYSNGMNDTISFIMPDSIQSIIDSFFVTIETDSTIGSPVTFARTFGFELQLGSPDILIVDDDRGGDNQQAYADVLSRMMLPADVWDVTVAGKPGAADLKKYSIVFWVTGWNPGTPLAEQDMIDMKSFLDDGGNLFLSTDTLGVSLMGALDPAFMSDYLHTQYAGSNLKWFILTGPSGDPIWGGLRSIVLNALWQTSSLLTPVNGGETALILGDTNDVRGVCGVSYSGMFKTLISTFPPESINNNQVGFDPIDSLMSRVIEFFGLGFKTGVEEDQRRAYLPRTFELEQNYPNPFNPATNISYTIQRKPGSKGPVKSRLVVFNLLGREVRVLVDEYQSPGRYSVKWDGLTSQGTRASSGVYFYRLTYGDQNQTKKMVLLK